MGTQNCQNTFSFYYTRSNFIYFFVKYCFASTRSSLIHTVCNTNKSIYLQQVRRGQNCHHFHENPNEIEIYDKLTGTTSTQIRKPNTFSDKLHFRYTKTWLLTYSRASRSNTSSLTGETASTLQNKREHSLFYIYISYKPLVYYLYNLYNIITVCYYEHCKASKSL